MTAGPAASTPLRVRSAERDDAPAACRCVRRSIIELCVADHRHDAATLARWLGNKTDARFAEWIVSPRHCAVVAGRDADVIGFGLLDLDGTLALLYVDPSVRFEGVSSAMLAALEDAARRRGIARLRLLSSGTALQFYLARGYLPDGSARPGFGVSQTHPLVRDLQTGATDR
jgi:GNAT superfamily N-acetyltransferase